MHWGFVLTGVVTTMLGPLLPALGTRWALTDERAGYLFAAQFLSSLAATLFCGRLCRRAGFLQTLATGFGCMAAGVMALDSADWRVGLAGATVWGAGLGLVVPASNLLVAGLAAKRGAAAALNVLNVMWGVGAVGAPLLIALVLQFARLEAFSLGLAALLAGTALAAWVYRGSAVDARPAQSGCEPARPVQPAGSIALLTAALLFLYVGVENGISGWMPSFTMRVFRLDAGQRALAQSVFWGAILTGRLVAPMLLKRLSGPVLIVLGSVLSFAALTTVLLSSQLHVVFAGTALAGAGLAAIYPTAIAIYCGRYAVSPPPNAGLVFAAGSLGGAFLPWLVGAFSTGFQSLRAGMALPLACLAVMTAVQLGIRRRLRAHG